MTDKLKESLSAFMDHEADQIEVRRVLKEINTDSEQAAELLECWQNYHLLRGVVKKDIHSLKGDNAGTENLLPSKNFLLNIQNAIERENHAEGQDWYVSQGSNLSEQSASSKKNVFISYLGQGAIAASVALFVFATHSIVLNKVGVDTPTLTADLSTELTQDNLDTQVNIDADQEFILTALDQSGEFSQGEHSRVASIRTKLDEQTRNRLSQAVYREINDNEASLEIPVSMKLNSAQ